MVKDGIYYALATVVVALLANWLTGTYVGFALLPLTAFFLWFFRDPERTIPAAPGLVVSPADGKVTDVSPVQVDGATKTRISIFLNVFDVHVNRTPISGTITHVEYRSGKFGNAMGAVSSENNEQNIVTVQGEGHTVIFKQIAGLIARRIVFWPKVGDVVQRGQRIGLIKFGSRTDVVLDAGYVPTVRVGERVSGGSSVIARAGGTQ
jgi:phosphatidylserine decarboxylase